MPSQHVKLPDGTSAIVCTRWARRRCVYCGGPASQLCDFPIRRQGGFVTTCDRPLCRHCTTRLPGDRDLCKEHSHRADEMPGGAGLGGTA